VTAETGNPRKAAAGGDLEIGLQLWTIRDLMAGDLPAALAATRDAGFCSVELAGFAGHEPAVMAGSLRAAGLVASSAHVPYPDLRDGFEDVIASLRIVGCAGIVVPAFAPGLLADRESVMLLAASLESIGRRVADAGMSFALHDEESQFAPLEGTTPWSILVESTDPTLVSLQLDLFAMLTVGIDPLPLIALHAPRITSLHVCDRRDGRYVPVGHGEIDWRSILDAVAATPCRVLFVEDEGATDPVAAARASCDELRRLLGQPSPAPTT
jgi:sugar phosphate isomerase/epimerase